ncbi:four and a half LIM domains protein 5 isoform X1 [Rana temporaria]|uniref:four and a half LIM domains protein 5 isoform X1 n=2 Tax=Rana temporaria TaxID=8407 RepID=UPI001AADEB76|nr:four and a half LIM domains protein 5 isoform X1 [Rana temporaria]
MYSCHPAMDIEAFDCQSCKESLYGKKYTVKDDNPYCIKCFENLFANICEGCKKPIECDSKDLTYKDSHWHEVCFKCAKCTCSLVEKPFAAKDELLLCIDCYSNEYSSKCFNCKASIMPGSRKMDYKGCSWHETCFVCESCQQPLGSKPFIPKQSSLYCVQCFENQFASHCTFCKKAIITSGISFQDQPWHSECFLCTNCKKKLVGQEFTANDEDPYCLDCFGNLYAKKCTACAKPITGQGGAKYISFEDNHWHTDCFNCSKCTHSLIGQKFLQRDYGILCLQCGRDL